MLLAGLPRLAPRPANPHPENGPVFITGQPSCTGGNFPEETLGWGKQGGHPETELEWTYRRRSQCLWQIGSWGRPISKQSVGPLGGEQRVVAGRAINLSGLSSGIVGLSWL